MSTADIQTIHHLLAARLRKVKPTLPDNLPSDVPFADLGLSSLEVLTFLFELEDEFDVTVNVQEEIHVRTLGDACGLAQRLLAGHAA